MKPIINSIIVGDNLHCSQACFRMIVKAFSGKDPGLRKTDQLTGFVKGRCTWQFRTLLAYSGYGLKVVDHELFDARGFVNAPDMAIRKQVKDESVFHQILDETDIGAETKAVSDCMKNPNIKFIENIPNLSDVVDEISKNKFVVCNINERALNGTSGHMGHSVIVEHIGDDFVIFHDPAPPGILNRKVQKNLFYKSWVSPSESMANYISIGKDF